MLQQDIHIPLKGLNKGQQKIADKVLNHERINDEDCLFLFNEQNLSFVAALANYIRENKFGKQTFFNKNFHVEPTNLCVFTCKFCSYSRLLKKADEGWVMSKEQILHIAERYKNSSATEVHIVGGVHPKLTLNFFVDLLQDIRLILPDIHIKGFTAVELEYMFRKAKVEVREGLTVLKEAGLNSLPGGGSEIFDEKIRGEICGDKCSTEEWLHIHETAHELGMKSNCTILYGHVEAYHHRVAHMRLLRELQDKTGGFNCFIPLKFRNQNNEMSHVPELSVVEDMKNYAVSRIYLDNIPHLKAYWPMLGREMAQISLNYGVDDIDGTIDDSTKIYSMAGSEEQIPVMTTDEIVQLIKEVGKTPVERDSMYHTIRQFG